jgi:V-type H+-transporting ATPase subunit a
MSFFCRQFQAGGFLVTSGSHAVSERELDENVYSNDDYVETASLIEEVFIHYAL